MITTWLHQHPQLTPHYYVIITSLLRHYYIIITSLLHIKYFILLLHYYVIITSLLHHFYYIIFYIFTSWLRHDYVMIMSLLRHYYKWRNCVTISSLLLIITLAVSIKIPLLPIITIITYYYLFETEQLADVSAARLPSCRQAAAAIMCSSEFGYCRVYWEGLWLFELVLSTAGPLRQSSGTLGQCYITSPRCYITPSSWLYNTLEVLYSSVIYHDRQVGVITLLYNHPRCDITLLYNNRKVWYNTATSDPVTVYKSPFFCHMLVISSDSYACHTNTFSYLWSICHILVISLS